MPGRICIPLQQLLSESRETSSTFWGLEYLGREDIPRPRNLVMGSYAAHVEVYGIGGHESIGFDGLVLILCLSCVFPTECFENLSERRAAQHLPLKIMS